MKIKLSELDKLFDFEWEPPKEYNARLIERNDNERSILGSVACHTDHLGKRESFLYRALCYDANKKDK